MRFLHFLPKLVLAAAALVAAWTLRAQNPIGQQATLLWPRTSAGSSQLEDVEQRFGPFSIAGQDYTVVLHKKRLPGASDPSLAETLAALEIRDANGNAPYQKTFPYEVEEGRFRRSVSASARLLAGKSGTGLLVRYREEAAGSQTGESWQVIGVVNGKLALFGKPSVPDGGMAGPFTWVIMRGNGAAPVVIRPDIIEFRAWTGSFYVLVPVRVDWARGRLMPDQRCFEGTGGGGLRVTGCEMAVEVNRRPSDAELGFVRLLSEAHESVGGVQHVVVKRNSKVEFLEASAIVTWNESADLIQPGFSDVWVKVRIDDKEGWIHTDEDFAAVGLPGESRVR
jgi:hypothetical protein